MTNKAFDILKLTTERPYGLRTRSKDPIHARSLKIKTTNGYAFSQSHYGGRSRSGGDGGGGDGGVGG